MSAPVQLFKLRGALPSSSVPSQDFLPASPTSFTLYFSVSRQVLAMKNTTKIGIILIISTAFFAAEIAGTLPGFLL